ncbi:17720_t:CDS:2, partial [Racocetra fulgida]
MKISMDLYGYLSNLDIKRPDRLRPDYDTYFMYLAELVALRTNCIKRKVGCVLVKDSRIIATGYNGTAKRLKNCNDGNCEECSQGESGGKSSTCKCVHAEVNALLRENKGPYGDTNEVSMIKQMFEEAEIDLRQHPSPEAPIIP